jgi:hypothetical protein
LQDRYIKIAQEAEYSLQVGDMGFDYRKLETNLDPKKHKVIGGNHDNYTIEEGIFVMQSQHFLGDFGVHHFPGFGDVFFVRGSMSIDRKWRTEGVDWWPDEELKMGPGLEALAAYKAAKPMFVVTHDLPASILDHFTSMSEDELEAVWGVRGPSTTAKLLQAMYEEHQPTYWVFGHYHKDKEITVGPTTFICLDELSYRDFEPLGE